DLGGDAAEEGHHHIAQALTDQLGVGVVAGAGQAVGHQRAEQRLDGAEHGYRQGRGQQLAQQLEVDQQRLAIGTGQFPGQDPLRRQRRNAGMGYSVEFIAEAAAQSGDRHIQAHQQQPQQAAQQQGDQVAGDAPGQARPENQYCQGYRPHQGVTRTDARQCPGQRLQLVQIVGVRPYVLQAEKVLDLQGGDDNADPRGEAHHHRVGHELDQVAHARHSQHHQYGPGHQGNQQQAAQPVGLGNGQQYHHEGGGGTGDIEPRTSEQGDDQPADDTGIETMLGRHPDRDGQGHGQRDGDDAHGDAGKYIAAQAAQRIALTEAVAQGSEQGQGQ